MVADGVDYGQAADDDPPQVGIAVLRVADVSFPLVSLFVLIIPLNSGANRNSLAVRLMRVNVAENELVWCQGPCVCRFKGTLGDGGNRGVGRRGGENAGHRVGRIGRCKGRR